MHGEWCALLVNAAHDINHVLLYFGIIYNYLSLFHHLFTTWAILFLSAESACTLFSMSVLHVV
jgi:hypothetical protein